MGKLQKPGSAYVRLEDRPAGEPPGQPADAWLCVRGLIRHGLKQWLMMLLRLNTNSDQEETKKMHGEGQVCFFGCIHMYVFGFIYI